MRRRAALERMQQMVERGPLALVELHTPGPENPHQSARGRETRARTHLEDVLEDVLLHRRVVHAHRAAADLDAVEHQVVVLPADLRAPP